MTAAPAKFTFDLDMSGRRENSTVYTDDKLAELLANAREEGRAEGRREGQQNAVAAAAQAQQQAVDRLVQQAAQLLSTVDTIQLKSMADAGKLGKAIAKKLAHHLVEREPSAELESLLHDCLASIDHAPHLMIRCHPDLTDTMRETAEARMTTSGFEGRLVVMGEPEIALGDGRIEWADGGLVRDTDAVMAHVENCIQGYMRAKGVPDAEENEE